MASTSISATTLYLHFLLFILTFCSFNHQPSFAFSSQEYHEALEKSIMFFEGQRSGRLPSNQKLTWRGDSGLSDGSSYHVDLVGGYYDAGDNIKFGLPMAFTTTLLAWSVIEFGNSMHNQIDNAREAIRWSADYLLKAATTTPNTLYVQVGEPSMEHGCWERPEDMDTPRNVYKVFHFADRYRGSYNDSLNSVVCPFYCSYSGYNDELLWGASWIYKASGISSYMEFIRSNGHILGADDDGYTFSWDDKRPGTKILLSNEFLEKNSIEYQLYKARADNFICSLVPGTPGFQAQYTPGGVLYKGRASNLQYVTSTTFLILIYAKYLSSNGGVISCGTSKITENNLINLAKKQVDYILGDNPIKVSYMVGFGERYPKNIHHRGSSLPSIHEQPRKISCSNGFQYFNSGSPNPNVLVGAIVGGPDSHDNFFDDRNNYQQSEPATYINAPFVGALAFFSAQ
ncbi:endoglucanase 1-like isoform X2 [Vicia villosa]|uniref:endoglucanase 1-like isoform X2 n=1 Tax=Vicia villosa TaxID=3911 RepID=UPI00273CF3F0|nr:endoglucanase 1-like isoform X2 [Vicia villosa]